MLTLLLAGLALVSDRPPSEADVTRLETLRILEPLASPTRIPGRYIVEFAPDIETRNIACHPAAEPRVFECSFQTRVRKALADDFGPWTDRIERLRKRRGQWLFDSAPSN